LGGKRTDFHRVGVAFGWDKSKRIELKMWSRSRAIYIEGQTVMSYQLDWSPTGFPLHLFRAICEFQEEFKQPSRQILVCSAIKRANMRLIKGLRQLFSPADSRTETRVEQSEWLLRRTKSVEVIVETEEELFYETKHESPAVKEKQIDTESNREN